MTTLTKPTSGSAQVAGYDVLRQPDMVRRSMGLTGQVATVDELLTGRENIRMIGGLYGIRRKELARLGDELLEQFSIADAADRVVKSYSGGMRRRLDLAVSLLASPPVLFLDEPTTGLDLQSRQELWNTIRNLVQEGTTVILTTQYLEEADQLADDLVVIDHGRIIAQGTAGELKRNLGGTVIELTMGEGSDVDKAVSLVGSVIGTEPERHGALLRMPSPDGSHLLTQMLRRLDDEGVQPSGVALREPSLDDVFLALTGHAAEEGDVPANGQPNAQPNGGRKRRRS